MSERRYDEQALREMHRIASDPPAIFSVERRNAVAANISINNTARALAEPNAQHERLVRLLTQLALHGVNLFEFRACFERAFDEVFDGVIERG